MSNIDIFAVLDHVTNTEGVSIVQINNWLLTILGLFITVIIALFVNMNNRFDKVETKFSEAQTDRNSIKHGQLEHSIALAEIKAIMSITKAVEMGVSQEEVLNQADQEVKEKHNQDNQ
ncbi:hypothetical protein HC766_03805 [Candidatus Gracilibacteria bacterium]|nr:hypothetical protein [Candidatus Gracilibacteria bacterium]NJS41460.1 hypothetical protein [Candidatus Gracilibacteria bacterium]